jgi:hypothetical protein
VARRSATARATAATSARGEKDEGRAIFFSGPRVCVFEREADRRQTGLRDCA